MKTFAFTFFLLIGFVSSTQAQTPEGVQIIDARMQGSGCQNDTARAVMSPDGKAFSVFMDNYSAAADPGFTLDRKACTVNLSVVSPPGWSFTIASADYRGFINAEAGTQVSHQVLYAFDGSTPPNERPGFGNSPGKYSFLQKIFHGPMTQDYFVRNVIDARAQLWSPCSGRIPSNLLIQTFLTAKINAPGREAQITLDSVDGVLAQQFSFTWKKCLVPNDPDRNPLPGPPPGRGGGRRPPRFPSRF